MGTSGIVALVAIALVGTASAIIGKVGVRVARSTSDFLVALAWRYTRVADRVEQNFADHVQD